MSVTLLGGDVFPADGDARLVDDRAGSVAPVFVLITGRVGDARRGRGLLIAPVSLQPVLLGYRLLSADVVHEKVTELCRAVSTETLCDALNHRGRPAVAGLDKLHDGMMSA